MFAVIPGYPGRANGDSQHLEAHPELQDWLRFELFTVKITGQSPFLSVLKRCVPKTLAFAFGLRLRSKTQCFKTRVLGRRLPNGNPKRGCDLRPCVAKR